MIKYTHFVEIKSTWGWREPTDRVMEVVDLYIIHKAT
jgi:hypothetical protein